MDLVILNLDKPEHINQQSRAKGKSPEFQESTPKNPNSQFPLISIDIQGQIASLHYDPFTMTITNINQHLPRLIPDINILPNNTRI